MNSDSRSQTHAGLPQPRLIVARMVWAVVAGLALTIFALSQPTFIDRVRSIHLDLAELGLSLDFALPYFLILNAAPLLTFSLVAGVIFWRKSDEWIALLTSLTLLTFPLFATPSVSIFASEQRAWMLLANGMSGLGQGLFILLLYLFPNGQFAPRWARVPVIGWAALAVVVLTFSDLSTSQVSLPIVLVILIGYGTGVFAQFYRYRRVSGLVERQQTKWIVLGLMATITVILFGFALFRIGAIGLFGGLVLFLVAVGSLLLIPLSIGISILRYRLFEIDFLINRTLVYGALTGLLLAFFGVNLFVISQVFQNFVGGPLVAVAVSALAFGVVFQPARRNLQRFVDQRFYNIHIDYQKAESPVPAPISIARVFTQARLGAYTGLELIGRGGMAEVYKSTHLNLNRSVAIKILSAALAADPELRKRFEREAKIVSNLKHPNIVEIIDFGEEAGTLYMVMEYIAGENLSDYLRANGRLPLDKALPIIKGVADALDYAHQRGLVHRDVKPSNVMLDGARPVLMDFGIAKIVSGNTRLTRTAMLGTFDYIAPEQIQASENVGGGADVYAFGVMVYQMLTGELPFKHANPGAILIAHMTQPAPDPCEVAPDLPLAAAHSIRRAMAKNPDERFATAGEFTTALWEDANIQ